MLITLDVLFFFSCSEREKTNDSVTNVKQKINEISVSSFSRSSIDQQACRSMNWFSFLFLLLPFLILDERVSNRIYANQLVLSTWSSFHQAREVIALNFAQWWRDFFFSNLSIEWELKKKKIQWCQLGMASAGSGRRLFFLLSFFSYTHDDDRILVCLQGTDQQEKFFSDFFIRLFLIEKSLFFFVAFTFRDLLFFHFPTNDNNNIDWKFPNRWRSKRKRRNLFLRWRNGSIQSKWNTIDRWWKFNRWWFESFGQGTNEFNHQLSSTNNDSRWNQRSFQFDRCYWIM